MRTIPSFALALALISPPSSFAMSGGPPVQPKEALVKSMVYIGETGSVKNCGGILLTNNFVLTASHCTHHLEEAPSHVEVVATVSSGKACGHARFERVYILPGAVKNEFLGVALPDIALVKLASPLCGTDPIDPASQIREFQIGQKYRVSGYGFGTKDDAVYPDRLDAVLEGNAESLLKKYYSDLEKTDHDYYLGVQRLLAEAGPHEFMLTPSDGKRAVCMGDSGSPIYQEVSGKVILFGLNSLAIPHSGRGIYDCNDSFLVGAARLQPYLSWIQETIRQ